MILLRPDLKVVVAQQPVDFRKGVHGLTALVAEALKADPYYGDVFVFRSRRADRLKLVLWDGTGMIIPTTRNLFKEGLVRFTARRWRRGPANAGAMGGQIPCPNQHRRPRW